MKDLRGWAARGGSALLIVVLSLAAVELALRTFMGFGSPILYENTFISGYRPLPNQSTRRIGGRLARASGARVLMVWHPSRAAATGRAADVHHERFLSACRDAALPLLDLLPVVQRAQEPAGLFVDSQHLDVRGHALYGATLGNALAARDP